MQTTKWMIEKIDAEIAYTQAAIDRCVAKNSPVPADMSDELRAYQLAREYVLSHPDKQWPHPSISVPGYKQLMLTIKGEKSSLNLYQSKFKSQFIDIPQS